MALNLYCMWTLFEKKKILYCLVDIVVRFKLLLYSLEWLENYMN